MHHRNSSSLARTAIRALLTLALVLGALAGGFLAQPEKVAQAQSTTLVINEIDYDQPGTDTAEFLEIRNISGSTISLGTYTIELFNASVSSVYQTITLPNVNLPAGDYYVICANAANTPNCDLDVTPDTNLIQNGSPDAVGLRNSGTLIDAVSYEGNSAAPYTETAGTGLDDTGAVAYQGISRYPNGTDTNVNNTDLSPRCITPGEANSSASTGCAAPVALGNCGDAATAIHDIQGSGSTSPLVGTSHIIEGVVTGDYQETTTTNPARPELSGFYIQEEDGQADADPATSEGIFVYDPSKLTEVAEGQVVRLYGTVSEYSTGGSSLTEITAAAMMVCSSGSSVTPASLDLPVPAASTVNDYYEPYEGMLVQFADQMTVTEFFELARYGQVMLSQGGKLRQYTQDGALPLNATDYNDRLDDANRRSVYLDDYNTQQNINPVFLPQPGGFSVTNTIRGGATVNSLTGILEWRFGPYWRVQPQKNNPVVFNNPARPATAPDPGGNIKVASMNVLNYFTTLDTGAAVCGPVGGLGCRGANSAAELTRQTDKIIAVMTGIDADAYGLMEIQNMDDGAGSAVQALVDAANAVAGAGTFTAVQTGADGTDAIKVAIIYKPGVLTPVGAPQVLDSLTFTDPNNIGGQQSRPALAQTFRVTDPANPDHGAVFTLVVLHLKSKSSSCGVGDDDDTTGQGDCNGTRTGGAAELLNWLATAPTGSTDPDVLIIGDFNAYYQEDPMQVFYNGGYTNVADQTAYSYVFSGFWGTLDHGVSSPSLTPQVVGAADWHVNADENSLLDYNDTTQDPGEQSFEAKPAANPLYAADQYRASDHDPLIIGLNLGADLAPQVTTTDPADGATGVGQAANVSIAFSEDVDTTSASFNLNCSVSSGHSFALVGGPVLYTLNPDADFVLGETCTVAVVAANVADVDINDPPDNMAANYVFSFLVGAGGSGTGQPGTTISDPTAGVTSLPATGYPAEDKTEEQSRTQVWLILIAMTILTALMLGIWVVARARR
jgi:hypothetical protein